jgi:hypothetical protein
MALAKHSQNLHRNSPTGPDPEPTQPGTPTACSPDPPHSNATRQPVSKQISPAEIRLFDDKGKLLVDEKTIAKLGPVDGARLRAVIDSVRVVEEQEGVVRKLSDNLESLVETRNRLSTELAKTRPSFHQQWRDHLGK